MPETFNPIQPDTTEPADMFADVTEQSTSAFPAPAIEPMTAPVEAVPEFESTNPALSRSSASVPAWRLFWYRYRRWVIIIVSCLAGLVLLGIGIQVLFGWLAQRQPVTNTTNTTVNTNTIVNTPVVNPTTNTPPTTPTTSFTDSDHDGLSDEEELVENTNPKKQDTDADGLSDREEVKVYRTDPRNPDTDGDGYQDGTEVTHFYDPNNSNSKARLPGLN